MQQAVKMHPELSSNNYYITLEIYLSEQQLQLEFSFTCFVLKYAKQNMTFKYRILKKIILSRAGIMHVF